MVTNYTMWNDYDKINYKKQSWSSTEYVITLRDIQKMQLFYIWSQNRSSFLKIQIERFWNAA